MKDTIFYNSVICRYSEIALKGKNRWKFEQFLIGRITKLLKSINSVSVSKIRGRILINLRGFEVFSEAEISLISDSLKRVFGLDSFSFALRVDSEINIIENSVSSTIDTIIDKVKKQNLSFRVRARRAYKKFSLSSKEIEIKLADIVLTKYPNLTVNLKEADVTLFIEVHKDKTYLFYDIIRGEGGLPTGSNPPVLSLISGGFDSPVASYMIMRRGVFVDFLTFHSAPFTPDRTVIKIKNLVNILNKYQGNRKLFICNLLEVQKIICAETYESLRTIFYRRYMFRLAELIAKKNNNLAIVTGESVGQVASQTIINLANIESAIDTLVLRPLIAMDKIDIMNLAEKIGTYDISKEQTPDSCTVFSPTSPSTGAQRYKVLNGEKKLNEQELIALAYANTTVYDPETEEEMPIDKYFSLINAKNL